MITDRIDEIDNCPEGGERELIVSILERTFASTTVAKADPDWAKKLIGNMTDEDAKRYLSGLRDRLLGYVL